MSSAMWAYYGRDMFADVYLRHGILQAGRRGRGATFKICYGISYSLSFSLYKTYHTRVKHRWGSYTVTVTS